MRRLCLSPRASRPGESPKFYPHPVVFSLPPRFIPPLSRSHPTSRQSPFFLHPPLSQRTLFLFIVLAFLEGVVVQCRLIVVQFLSFLLVRFPTSWYIPYFLPLPPLNLQHSHFPLWFRYSRTSFVLQQSSVALLMPLFLFFSPDLTTPFIQHVDSDVHLEILDCFFIFDLDPPVAGTLA